MIRHIMETFSVLLTLCEGIHWWTAVPPNNRPVMQSFDVFISWRGTGWCSCGVTVMEIFIQVDSIPGVQQTTHKQRVLMHRHQGWNVRHGLCHIYMRYLYIYELFIAFVCFVVCSLLQRDGIFGVLCRKWQARESTGMFGNLMAIYYIMPQFIQNHSRFVMLMKTCMIS